MNSRYLLPLLAFASGSLARAQTVNYNEHIAPLIHNNCTVCHREGEIGPMPLTTYEEVSAWGESIQVVTEEKTMPPWPPDRSYSRFVGERALTNEQTELIADWVAAGMPEGDPDNAPVIPEFPEGSVLGEPDLTLTMANSYTIKGNGRDEYRVFVLPTGLTEDKDVVAVEFRPGNAQIVHHALITYDTTGEARKLDREDAAEGYSSFGGFGVPARDGLAYPGWVPGATPSFFPAGTGLKLPAGADLVVQIHYAPWPVRDSDQSSINLFFSDEPVERYVNTRVMLPSDLVDDDDEYYQLSPLLGALGGAVIASGVEEFLGESISSSEVISLARNATLDTVFGDQLGGTVGGFLEFDIKANRTKQFRGIWHIKKDISLFNVWPHMHYLGKNWEIELETPDGTIEPIIRINNWDFNWQGNYTFPRFIKAPAGSRIIASALYDNTRLNFANPNSPPDDVSWGEKTTDEMYFLPFSYVDYRAGDEDILLENFSPGDLPVFRIDQLTDTEVKFRLQNTSNAFEIEHSRDLQLWQRVSFSEEEGEHPDWTNVSLERNQDSAGFYRAKIFTAP